LTYIFFENNKHSIRRRATVNRLTCEEEGEEEKCQFLRRRGVMGSTQREWEERNPAETSSIYSLVFKV